MCTRPSVAALGIRAESGPGELGIAVLTTLPVTGYEVLRLGVALADNIPRVAQVLSLQLTDGTVLRLVNTHLTHMLTGPLQLRLLRRRLRSDAMQPNQVPTIIAGDLNMPRLLAGRTIGYGAMVLGPTWPSDQPLIQLDHVLASRGISRLDGAVLAPTGSDHRPIRARLRVQPASSPRPARAQPARNAAGADALTRQLGSFGRGTDRHE
jgi:endonuclease/exonuclease/phosphatase family metal-dependent hydrolase